MERKRGGEMKRDEIDKHRDEYKHGGGGRKGAKLSCISNTFFFFLKGGI